MEDACSILSKRTIDQVENQNSNLPNNKKSKIDDTNQTKENIVFSDLPPEIRHQILSYIVGDHERLHIRLVCQKWFNTINYNEFKVGILLASEADEFYRVFNRYERPISIKFRRPQFEPGVTTFNKTGFISPTQIEQKITKLTQLTSLDLGGFKIEFSRSMTKLQALTTTHPLRSAISYTTFTNLTRLKTTDILKGTCKLPPNLASLDFETYGIQKEITTNTHITELKIASFDELALSSFSNLRKLEICQPTRFFMETRPSSLVLPNLEKLVSYRNVPEFYGSNLTKLHLIFSDEKAILEITTKLTNLKKLLCHNIKWTQACGSVLTLRLRTTATNDNYQRLNDFKKLVDLKLTIKCPLSNLDLSMPNLTSLELHSSYSRKLISKLTNLIELKWECPTLTSHAEPLIFADLQRLTWLEIAGKFDLITVLNLTSLQLLEINNANQFTLHINGLTSLTSLLFASAQPKALKNWSDLAHLTNLRSLGVQQEIEPGDIRYLTALAKLTSLVINCTGQYLDSITKLTRLQHLDITTDLLGQQICDQIGSKLPFCYSVARTYCNKQHI